MFCQTYCWCAMLKILYQSNTKNIYIAYFLTSCIVKKIHDKWWKCHQSLTPICCIVVEAIFFYIFLKMMRNLLCEEGGLLQVESASLPVASYAKFQPQSVDFLDITNPKAVYPLLHVQLMNAFIYNPKCSSWKVWKYSYIELINLLTQEINSNFSQIFSRSC